MLALLAANWSLLLFRGLIAVLFGILVLSWTGPTTFTLAFLLGAYALIDGLLALFVIFRARAGGFAVSGSLLFEGLVRIGAGASAFEASDITDDALLTFFSVWVISSGIAEIVVAIALRKEVTGEWPLPLAGTLSIIFGVLMLWFSSVEVLALVMGSYVIIFGLMLTALALRLRQLADEMHVAAISTSSVNSSHSIRVHTRNSSRV
jgi:uncharacterized membrane protein HdeD (DUF308 family)